jgi:predicted kinase
VTRVRHPGAVWVVAGAPGAGKSTVARLLAEVLDPAPARLDKDTLFGGLVGALLEAHGRSAGEREGGWYDEHVKVHEYAAMTATARDVRSTGCSVVLDAPFTTQIRDPERWAAWVVELGGPEVRLVWVRSDRPTLRERLAQDDQPVAVGPHAEVDPVDEPLRGGHARDLAAARARCRGAGQVHHELRHWPAGHGQDRPAATAGRDLAPHLGQRGRQAHLVLPLESERLGRLAPDLAQHDDVALVQELDGRELAGRGRGPCRHAAAGTVPGRTTTTLASSRRTP